MQILKYKIPTPNAKMISTVKIEKAFFFKILDIDTQINPLDLNEPIYLWAVVQPAQVDKEVKFYVVPTGVELPKDVGPFIKTIHFTSGSLVFHIFEVA